MKAKTPLRIRKDLEAARSRVELLISVLQENQRERRWGLGEQCERASSSLSRLLAENLTPEDYKVAVIGRFKAGKSSFVNELLGRRLAGEDTNPETAAVTTFSAGERVLAKIRLISKETWDELKALHSKDPTDPAGHRIANWLKFTGKDGRVSTAVATEIFDLGAIEREHIKTGGHTLTIRLPLGNGAETDRKAEADFRRRIKQFTSSTKPHHCLVDSIEIETPSAILQEGVILIDTPGLDDTERYRVHLTERAVQGVDAVLFLTKSGASYGQAEKDFLLSLLRKGTVKQLIFVVTQVDQTYEQHVRQAKDQDEEPEPIMVRVAAERRRIRAEIEATLDELGGDAAAASTSRYREQLNSVEIAFTSAANHRDHVRKDPVKYPVSVDDPGGMNAVKRTLFRILSTESRLAGTKRAIEQGAKAVLQDMLSVIEKRRLVMAGIKNGEVAEEKLSSFRQKFEQNGLRFAEVTRQASDVLKKQLVVQAKVGKQVSENIALLADSVLGTYETDDAGRHWRTRRSGHWGYMVDLQSRVANRVFPKVSEHLNDQTGEFGIFIETFRAHLDTLSGDASRLIRELEIGDELQLDIGSSLAEFLEDALETQQELVLAEEARIVALLEQFVDAEVENKISEARERVASVWGRGTTVGQTNEIKAFYAQVRSILRQAVQSHVEKRFNEFAEHLTAQADALPERSISQVGAQLERASADIKAAAEATFEGQKEAFSKIAEAIFVSVETAQREISELLNDDEQAAHTLSPVDPVVSSPQPVTSIPAVLGSAAEPQLAQIEAPDGYGDDDTPGKIRKVATNCVKRYMLRNGDKGWPFSRIFAAEYLRGATEVWLVDPYLAQPHQRRNLREFLEALTSVAKPKNIHVVTREVFEDSQNEDRSFYASLDKALFEKAGAKVSYTLDSHIHDRFVVLDNGIMFKLGRGLDIYKPVAGLASRDPGLRQARASEIDVFASDEAKKRLDAV